MFYQQLKTISPIFLISLIENFILYNYNLNTLTIYLMYLNYNYKKIILYIGNFFSDSLIWLKRLVVNH